MAAGAQLRGADNLVRTLDDAARRLLDLTEAEQSAGQLLAEAGRAASPRKTGRMAGAHGYDVVDATVSIVVATDYAPIVHAQNPWLTDTVTAHEEQVADIYLSGVEDALSIVKGT